MKLGITVITMTQDEYRENARLYDDLTTNEKRIADERTLKETGDSFRSPRWVYDRRNGEVLGDDIEGDIYYCLRGGI
jgi:hypothetical protein